MKINSTFQSGGAIRILFYSLAIAAVLPLHAQGGKPEPAPSAVEVRPSTDLIPAMLIDGECLYSVGELLHEKLGANVVICGEVVGLRVPKMELRNVSGLTVLRAIASAGLPIQVTETTSTVEGGSNIWVVAPSQPAPPQGIQTKIFNLQGAAADRDKDPDAILVKGIDDAIAIAMMKRKALGGEELGNIDTHYHAQTGLLLVSGSPQCVEIANQVICALGGKVVK